MLGFLHNQQGKNMRTQTKPCPICKNDALAFTHINELVSLKTKTTIIRSVPSVTYICGQHGWFSLSEQINSLVTSSSDPVIHAKLAAKVKEGYFPEDDQPLSLKPIESLD